MMVKLLEFTLMREGYTVSVCREGDTVADKARKEKPDLLLVDYILPGMTGDQVASVFQDDEELSKLPSIVVTGLGRESIRKKMLELGGREVFTKPFSPITLMAEIKKYLS